MNLQAGKAIYNILSTTKEVTDIVDSKIFPLVAENGTNYPFIIYKRNSNNSTITKDKNPYQSTAIVEMAIVSDKYEESINLAEKVCKALNGRKGTYNNVKIANITCSDASEDYVDNAFVQNIITNITINN